MRAALVALALLGSCDSYDPDLGAAPFSCGTDEPRCPDGYLAVDVSAIRCECREARVVDAGPYACNGDPNEPNESASGATPTPIGANPAINYSNLAICPADEEDNYAMDAPQLGALIVVRVTFDQTRTPPRVDILDAGGASLDPTMTSPQPGMITATHVVMRPGRFYARIRAGIPLEEVNYDLRLELTPPS
jgi:hypothetical protein